MKLILTLLICLTSLFSYSQESGSMVEGQDDLATCREYRRNDTVYNLTVNVDTPKFDVPYIGKTEPKHYYDRKVFNVSVRVPKGCTPHQVYLDYIDATSAEISEWRHTPGKGWGNVLVYNRNPMTFCQWLLLNDLKKQYRTPKCVIISNNQ